MKLLKKVGNPVELQVLCDALESRGVSFHVDNAGMNALMPVPGLFDARVMVEEGDMSVARQILTDLGMEDSS